MEYTTIKARGFEFEALTDGPEDGELVLLLHGLPRNCWEWHHQIPAIAALGFHVVAPDLRGFCVGVSAFVSGELQMLFATRRFH